MFCEQKRAGDDQIVKTSRLKISERHMSYFYVRLSTVGTRVWSSSVLLIQNFRSCLSCTLFGMTGLRYPKGSVLRAILHDRLATPERIQIVRVRNNGVRDLFLIYQSYRSIMPTPKIRQLSTLHANLRLNGCTRDDIKIVTNWILVFIKLLKWNVKERYHKSFHSTSCQVRIQ